MPDVINQNGTWVIQPDVDLTDLNMNVIDLTDGSWTLIDLNSGIQSTQFANKTNKITTNAISAGSVNQAASAQYYGPRWFKLLKDENGNQLTQNDNFIFIATQQAQSASNPPPFGLAIGTCIRPYATGSTNENNQLYAAGALCNNGTGNTGTSEYFQQAISAGGTIGSQRVTTGSINRIVKNYNGKSGVISAVVSSTANNGAARCSANLKNPATGSLDFFLQIGLTTRYNSTSTLSGAEIKHIIKYKIIKLGV